MQEFLSFHYEWLRALHIIAVMSWMAGMLYLPRLFVYHVDAEKGSVQSETFKVMERRLLKYIMSPAMMIAWVFGLLMIYANPGMMSGQGWLHVKLFLVVLMSGAHGFLAGQLRKFSKDENEKSAKFFKIVNEVPTVLMILIVILAVVQPF
ncbi:MAG: protoporphyrinogen oxidase HemJ [Bdellovibrionales bacterium]